MTEYGNEQTAQMATPPPAAGVPADVPPPPPPAAPVPPTRQLVRDPYTRLGGVASGLGHYFGIDVSLVRLAFVLLTLFSGIGLVAYLLAWLVVPRAQYWPPTGSPRPLHSITPRELGIGLVILVLLLALFANGGWLARSVVPLFLIAGGVWMLRQPASPPVGAPHPVAPPVPPVPPVPAVPSVPVPTDGLGPFSTADATQPSDTVFDPFAATPPPIPPPVPPAPPASHTPGGMAPGTPVPPPRRRWLRRVIGLIIGLIVVALLIVALVIGAVIGGVATTGITFSARYQPETVEDIPTSINHDAGDIELDLTRLSATDFAGDDVRIDLDLDLGEVTVKVPDGLPVRVDAAADVGDVTVFDRHDDGIDPSVERADDEPLVDLDIKLGAGQISVVRADPTD